MTKRELRKKYDLLRKKLSIEEVDQLSKKIADAVPMHLLKNKLVHLFIPIENKKEINTYFIKNKINIASKLATSKCNFKTETLEHYMWTENTKFKLNKFNVPEPIDGQLVKENEIDIVFIPLLAYDTEGNRVGYGKGFYDKFLSKCRKDTIKIGISFFDPEQKIRDVNLLDIPLNYCITPTKVYEFKR